MSQLSNLCGWLRSLIPAMIALPAAIPATLNATTCSQLPVSAISASTNDGNVPQNAVDRNLWTRWSGEGIGAYITADLGSSQTICGVNVAWYQGNQRRNYFVISLSSDGVSYHTVYNGTSSGTTTGLEVYSFASTAGRYVRVTVNGNTVNDWASIAELQVNGTTSACSFLPVSTVTASTNDGNVPSNVTDWNFSTRWSGSGIGAYITADLATSQNVCNVNVSWYQGNQRQNFFVISTSTDGTTFHQVYSGTSSGRTTGFEAYSFTETVARYVRVTVNGNTVNNWASITELQINRAALTYDQTVLNDKPVLFLDVSASGSTEADLTNRGHNGTYQGGVPSTTTAPNGDLAAVFNGSTQYLQVASPSDNSFSIPATHSLTWEMWISPSTLQFPNEDPDGYVDVMGKCATHGSPATCEWESRMYSTTTAENPNRPNRLSAYVFNPTAKEGSGAFWQPVSNLFQAGAWLHVVGEYTTLSQPADCQNTSTYPGSIDIWVNGVKWDQSYHGQTGCMSQFSVIPQANNSPLNIGTMALDTWFEGAIAKVAIYPYLLTQTQITNHYQSMTTKQPTGSCTDNCTF